MITVLKFYADWCAPCKAFQPTWEKLQDEYGDELIFQSVDIEANPQTRLDYHVRTIPTMIAVKDGKELSRLGGQRTFAEIQEWLANEQGNL